MTIAAAGPLPDTRSVRACYANVIERPDSVVSSPAIAHFKGLFVLSICLIIAALLLLIREVTGAAIRKHFGR